MGGWVAADGMGMGMGESESETLPPRMQQKSAVWSNSQCWPPQLPSKYPLQRDVEPITESLMKP